MNIDIGNEKIAKFMGYPLKVEVTNFNYGMDYHHSYDKEFIYCNKMPNLTFKEDKFVNQVLATYDNFFDSDNQDDDFKYLSFLNYDRDLNSIIEVLRKIDSLGYFSHIKESYLSLNISKIWLSVIEFLDWYERDNKIETIIK